MKRTLLAFAGFALASGNAYPQTPNPLVVHEWGTFTSLQGSNGEVQEGMHREEESLPSFVHGRDPLQETGSGRPNPRRACKGFESCHDFVLRPKLAVTQKMETPVLYFYSPTEQSVKVDIGFPKGIISQYFPKPTSFSPPIGGITELAGGHVSFDVKINKGKELPIPPVDASSVYAPSRNVKADTITVGTENEKLIFYRGLGNFSTSLKVTSKAGKITLVNDGPDAISEAFLVNSNGTHVGIIRVNSIAPGLNPISESDLNLVRSNMIPYERFMSLDALPLLNSLKRSGLHRDEALAMVNTWKHSYFRTPGLRVLYILPRKETDAILPLSLSVTPKEVVRTLVGRVEVMLDTEEQALLARIKADGDGFNFASLGKLAEPKLRRLLQIAEHPTDDVIKKLIVKASR